MSDLRTRLDTGLLEYRIEGQVGEGGMAVVFLAQDLKHDRRVALKVLKPDVGASLGSDRFLREIDIAAKLSHPHILPLYDSGEVDGLHYIVMPYVEGESLRERLDRDGPLELHEAIRIAVEIAGALEYAHERGLIHRDVKPANILFQSGHAAVTDFGIARGTTEGEDTRLTQTGMAVGTVAYMSPEQATGDADLDARADVYALGCVLFEMLEGVPPFAGRTPQAVLASKITGVAPEFSSQSDVPATLVAVVRKALATSREDRHATSADLADELNRAITFQAIEDDTRRRQRAGMLRALGVVTGVAVLVAGGTWLSSLTSGPSIERLAVLPFENLRNDSTEAFFLEGMHYALISEMGQAGIHVKTRRSVMRYQDDNATPIQVIAQELVVDAVLSARAFHNRDSVGIAITLADGTSEAELWSWTFATEARGVVRLYREATSAIAQEIGLPLSPDVAARLASAAPVDPAAYEAYLNGMSHWYRVTPQDLELAEAYFERALEIDPDYALAHRGIASVWAGRQQFGLASPAEAGPRLKAAAQRALEADSTIADVQLILATQLTWTDWDWEGAEDAFTRAIDLNPSHWEARAFYAHLLAFLGRFEEATDQAEAAVTGDGLNSLVGALGCVTRGLVRRYEDAIPLCEKTLEADPTQGVALDGLAIAYYGLERRDEFLANRIRFARFFGYEEQAQILEGGLTGGGFEQTMALSAEAFVAQSEVEFVPPGWIAGAFADAGETELALDWLERALEMGSPGMPYAMTNRWPPEVEDSPRFADMRRRMGLPERN